MSDLYIFNEILHCTINRDLRHLLRRAPFRGERAQAKRHCYAKQLARPASNIRGRSASNYCKCRRENGNHLVKQAALAALLNGLY
jgi:hypothetical protein